MRLFALSFLAVQSTCTQLYKKKKKKKAQPARQQVVGLVSARACSTYQWAMRTVPLGLQPAPRSCTV